MPIDRVPPPEVQSVLACAPEVTEHGQISKKEGAYSATLKCCTCSPQPASGQLICSEAWRVDCSQPIECCCVTPEAAEYRTMIQILIVRRNAVLSHATVLSHSATG